VFVGTAGLAARVVAVRILEARGDVDLKPGERDRAEPFRSTEEPEQATVELKGLHRHQGRDVFSAFVANDEVGPRHMNGGKCVDAEGLELNLAVQAIGQRIDYEL